MSNLIAHVGTDKYHPYAKWIMLPLATSSDPTNYTITRENGGVEDGDLVAYCDNFYDDGTASISGGVSAPSSPILITGVANDPGKDSDGLLEETKTTMNVNFNVIAGANSPVDDSSVGSAFLIIDTGQTLTKSVNIQTDASTGQDLNDQYQFAVCLGLTNEPRGITGSAPVLVFREDEGMPQSGLATKFTFVEERIARTATSKRFNRAAIKLLGVSELTADATVSGAGVEIFSLSSSMWTNEHVTFDLAGARNALRDNKLFVFRMLGLNSTAKAGVAATTTESGCTKLWSKAIQSTVVDGALYTDCLAVNKDRGELWSSTFASGLSTGRGISFTAYLFTYDQVDGRSY